MSTALIDLARDEPAAVAGAIITLYITDELPAARRMWVALEAVHGRVRATDYLLTHPLGSAAAVELGLPGIIPVPA